MEIGAAVHPSVDQPRARFCSSGSEGYSRHRPEFTALYAVVRDNLETLYGAISDGALDVRVPKHARRELEAYLGCGIPCWRGFARFRCRDCGESRIVAFTCKGRDSARLASVGGCAPRPPISWNACCPQRVGFGNGC